MITDRNTFKSKKNSGEMEIGGRSLEQHLLEGGITQPFFIKELLSEQDWSAFKSKTTRGRRPYSPEAMVGLILYGMMQGISSLRDLSRFARVDLGCMYLTGGAYPDFTSIGNFIRRHQDTLNESFFVNLTKSILKKTRSSTRSLAGDGTIIESASSRYNLMKEESLKEYKAKIQAALADEPDNEKLQSTINLIEKAEKVLSERIEKRKEQRKPTSTVSLNINEPEAVVQPTKKGKTSVPSYKPSVLANDQRIVVAKDVDPSNEVTSLVKMLDSADSNYEEGTQELLLDGGYHNHKILNEAVERDINILCSSSNDKKKCEFIAV